jgi:hypothetical protein
MATQPLDASGEARRALQSVAADYGTPSLSDAQFLNNVLQDLLPDQPREASVLVAAASADVAQILRERTDQHISASAAIAQAATALEERTALTKDACQWAARQMASALGLLQDPEPGTAEPEPGAANRPPSLAGPESGTTAMLQLRPPLPPSSRAKSRTAPPPSKAPSPAAQRRLAAWLIPVTTAVAIIVYLVIAGTAHLVPFSRASAAPQSAPEPSPAQTVYLSPRPSPSSPPSLKAFRSTAADRRLRALIPTYVRAGDACQAGRPEFGAIASINCNPAVAVAAKIITYYLFSNTSRMNGGYAAFLRRFAHTAEDSASCVQNRQFTLFVRGCEEGYSAPPSTGTSGRVAEYIYGGAPDITSTDSRHKLLVDAVGAVGAGGNSLVRWWTHSSNSIKGGA